MNKHILKQYVLAAYSLMLISAVTGCSDDATELPALPEGYQREVTEVPLTISLGGGWSVDTDDYSRAAPPGAGGEDASDVSKDGVEETGNVDKVRVVAFRRPDVDNSSSAAGAVMASEPFRYDATNDMVLDVEPDIVGNAADKFGDSGNHKVARGKLTKVYGFEYRVVAIAYDSKRKSPFSDIEKTGNSTFVMPDGEDNWFEFTDLNADTTLEDFKLSVLNKGVSNDEKSWKDFFSGYTSGIWASKNAGILSERVAQIPQLFYGECYAAYEGNDSKIIKYAVTDAEGKQITDVPVKGILYRGLAKVELRIYPENKILGRNYPVEWICLMADNVITTVGLSDYDDFLNPGDNPGNYTALAYCKVTEDESKKKVKKVITAYMLPCKTHLAVRVKTSDHDIRNAQLTSDNFESYGNGTGIISPDVHDNVFYLRRNHKYVLTVNSGSETLIKNHEIK